MKRLTSMPEGPEGLPTVARCERLRTGYAALAIFLLLCSYTMLRPVRDDMAVRFGADRPALAFHRDLPVYARSDTLVWRRRPSRTP